MALTLIVSQALAANLIWDGTTGNSWSVGSNWQGGAKPGTGDTAVFTLAATAGLVVTSGGPGGVGETATGIEFQSGGWELSGFFIYNQTLVNTGSNTIHVMTTRTDGVADWDIATDSSLTLTGASRSGNAAYSINIGHNTVNSTLNVGGGGTLILGAGIYGQYSYNGTSQLVLKDIGLVINTGQIFNSADLSGIKAVYVIADAGATLSIKTDDLSLLNSYVSGNFIRNNTGEEFIWTQNGDYYTYAAIPEPSALTLMVAGAALLVLLALTVTTPRHEAGRRGLVMLLITMGEPHFKTWMGKNSRNGGTDEK
jgi:hypothetical protein